MTELLLGLDLGTTNAKAAVYDLAGHLVAEAAVPYPTSFPRPGWAEQNPRDWTKALLQATQQVVMLLGHRVHDLVGVGLSAQGPGMVLVDELGAPLIDASPTWQDERCAPQGRKLYEKIGVLWPGLGGPFTNFPAKLQWAVEHQPEAAAQARYAVGVKDFVVLWLTGECLTEPTSGSGGGDWFQPVFDAIGWPLDRLARMLSPIDVVGQIRADRARQMGLPKPLPVIIGLNDGASATLSTGAVSLGDAIITLSTNGVLRVIMSEAVTSEVRLGHNLFNWPYLPPELWIAGGQTKAGASTLQWFADMVGGSQHEVSLDKLLAEAEASPVGSSGVTFLPYLMGRGSPHSNAAATGTFTGMTLATGRGDLTRAVLEGTAFALRDIQADFAQFGYPPRGFRLSGGGGRSRLWRQILADVLGQPLTYAASDSTLGAAMVASVGLGLHADLRSATQAMVRLEAHHEPVTENVSRYHTLYETFKAARDTLFPHKLT